jgi:hypothetical protein
MRADRATLGHWRANAKQWFAVDVANPTPRGFVKHRQPLTSSGNRKSDYVSWISPFQRNPGSAL